jgi:putative heme-binding domain-containing protein
VLARNEEGRAVVEGLLRASDVDVRIAALRAMLTHERNVLSRIEQFANDPSPAVRREAMIALRDRPADQYAELFARVADGYDGRDRFYLEAFGVAADRQEEAVYSILLKRLKVNDPRNWPDAFADIAWRLHPPSAVDALAARASSKTLSPARRRQAVDAIAFVRDEKAAEAMAQLASAGPDDVRPLAAWWLKHRAENDWKDYSAAREHAKPATTQAIDNRLAKRNADAEILLDASKPQRQRERALGRLAREADGGKLLIALAAEGKIPEDLKSAAAGPISHNPDLGVRAMASAYFPREAAGGKPLPPIKELAAMKGDAARGRAVFTGNAAACVKCHLFNGEGRDVGPDLSAIRTKYARPELLDAILNPSANIAFGYQPWIVQTKDNQVYAGFILGDGETVMIKESSGEQRTIPAAQIKKRVKQELSVMPDNISAGLTAQDLADLAEFLLTAPVAQN